MFRGLLQLLPTTALAQSEVCFELEPSESSILAQLKFTSFFRSLCVVYFSRTLQRSEAEAASQSDEGEPHASSTRVVRIQDSVSSPPRWLCYARLLKQKRTVNLFFPATCLCRKRASSVRDSLKQSVLAAPAPSQADIISFAYKAISTLNAVTCV